MNRQQRSIRNLVGAACAAGILLPSILGLLIRAVLSAKGVQVASLSEGLVWIFPLTLMVCFPFAAFALIAELSLKKAYAKRKSRFQMRLRVFKGALIGMIIVLGILLISVLQNIESIAYFIAFWPITIPAVMLYALAGGLIGAIVGWISARREHPPAPVSSRQNDDGPNG